MSKATCKTCGASGPPWKHLPSILDPTGIGDPGHKMPYITPEQVEANKEIGWFVAGNLVKQTITISPKKVRVVGVLTAPHQSSAEEDEADKFFERIQNIIRMSPASSYQQEFIEAIKTRDRTKAQELVARLKAEGPEDLAPDKVNPQPLEAFERGSNSANRAWRTLLDNLAKEQEE